MKTVTATKHFVKMKQNSDDVSSISKVFISWKNLDDFINVSCLFKKTYSAADYITIKTYMNISFCKYMFFYVIET